MGIVIVKFRTRYQFILRGSGLGKLKKELTENGYAEDGLVAWGNASSGFLFGGIGGALGGMHVISKKGDAIYVIPFGKEILYNQALVFEKQNIASATVKGLLGKKLVVKTKGGKEFKYAITQGAGDVKTILEKLGF